MIIRLNKDIYYYHYIRLEKLTKNIYRENDLYKKDKLYDHFFLMYEDRDNKIKVKKKCFKSLIRDLEKYKDLKSQLYYLFTFIGNCDMIFSVFEGGLL